MRLDSRDKKTTDREVIGFPIVDAIMAFVALILLIIALILAPPPPGSP